MPRPITRGRGRATGSGVRSDHKLGSLHDLFLDELKDLYSAEQQITKALPRVVRAAASEEFKQALRHHLAETMEQVRRLEQIFESLGTSGKGKKCRGMEGVLEEGAERIEEDAAPAVKDAGLISAAQRVEHYEMAGYGSVIAYAETLGDQEAMKLLRQTLEEEKKADEVLTDLSEAINGQAGDAEA